MKPAKWVVGAVLVVGIASGWLCMHLHPQENLRALIPAELAEQVELFEQSPLNRKLFTVVHAPDEAQAAHAAQTLQDALQEQGFISPLRPDISLLQNLVASLPLYFTPKDEQTLARTLTPTYARQAMQQNYQRLTSFEGFLVKPFIRRDPLHWTDLMTAKLAAINPHTDAQYQDGFLTSQDATVWVGVYDLIGTTDFTRARALDAAVGRVADSFTPGSEVFYLGGLRFTAENVAVIKHDLLRVSTAGIVGLAVIFFLFLRQKRALLIYLFPLLVLPPSALLTYCIFGTISGITLGFGSVVAGLSLDYAVYVFFALKYSPANAATTLNQVRKHVWSTYLTSCVCFVALSTSSVAVFKQLGVFAIIGLTCAALLALYLLPGYLYTKPIQTITTPRMHVRAVSKRMACLISMLLLVFGIWGVFNTRFSGDLEKLNAFSPKLQAQQQLLNRVINTAGTTHALVFTKGQTREEALQANERLGFLTPAALLFPSARAAHENQQRWQRFWTDQRRSDTQHTVAQAAQEVGFEPAAFAPFEELISPNFTPTSFDFTQFYNPFIRRPDGTVAVVNIVENVPAFQAAAQAAGAVWVSGPVLKKQLLSAIARQAVQLCLLAVLFTLLVAGWILKNLRHTVLAFTPVVLGACITFGCFGVLGTEVNLFVLVFLPLLIGLGIDYGLFQVLKYQSNTPQQYPPAALATAAGSTLAGFGVLVLAKHGVLHIMGLSCFLGVSGAVLVSLFIVPAFLEKE